MDDDQNELIPSVDDESLSENEDHCLPLDNPIERYRHNIIYVEQTKKEFLITKISLIFFTLTVLILFPLYIEAVNVQGDVYSLLFMNTLLSLLILILITVGLKFLISKYKGLRLFQLPIKISKLLQISLLYFTCGILITYALDRKRVVCHFQDPFKGLVLVFSLLYYFFFSKRLMCLQRIFSITVIIVGLFIALDYNLCNEFKCRGYEREHVSDDTGNWTRHAHAIWTTVYVLGLALFAAYFTILEHTFSGAIEMLRSTTSPFLSTLSSSVSTVSASPANEEEIEESVECKKINVFHLAAWLHLFGLLIIIVFYWTDFIPEIGKGLNNTEAFNYTLNGIRCHFSSHADCHSLALIVWLFVFGYVGFVVVLLQFLFLTQSAVYTVATAAAALPLAGICWALLQLVPVENGLLLWKPTFSGELISSLLSLPVIGVGLYFLYKSHSKDCHWSESTTENCVSTSRIT